MWKATEFFLVILWADALCVGKSDMQDSDNGTIVTENESEQDVPEVDMEKSNLFLDVLAFDEEETNNKERNKSSKEMRGPTRMFKSRSRKIKKKSDIENYSEALMKTIEDFSCAKNCSEFNINFDNQTHQLAEMLVDLPPVEGISIKNTPENMALVMKNLHTVMDKSFFQRSMILATLERNDTKDVKIKNAIFLQPENILPDKGLTGTDYAGEETNIDDFEQSSPLINTPESKIDYFREAWCYHDFHVTWHDNNFGRKPSSRRRERFTYTHRQILNRYIVERLNLGLQSIEPLDFETMERSFPSYYPNKNVPTFSGTKAQCRVDRVDELRRLYDQSMRKIRGSMEDFFGDVELGLHAKGHEFVSDFCKEDRSKKGFMYSPSVSGRDPIFYRWHLHIQNVLQLYHQDKPYTQRDLSPASGITVESVTLTSRCSQENMVETYYGVSDFIAKRNNWSGKTLKSEPFEISVSITNARKNSRKVIVRLFLVADQYKDTGEFAIEIDRFVQELPGERKIIFKRKSEHNSLTYQENAPSCAWPIYLYLPKGGEQSPNRFRLVVFIHDPTNSRVNEGTPGYRPYMLCGADSDDVNFDERNFGFPFDKEWRGTNIADVLNGRNREFGKISTSVDIVFSREKQATCNSDGNGPQTNPGSTPEQPSNTPRPGQNQPGPWRPPSGPNISRPPHGPSSPRPPHGPNSPRPPHGPNSPRTPWDPPMFDPSSFGGVGSPAWNRRFNMNFRIPNVGGWGRRRRPNRGWDYKEDKGEEDEMWAEEKVEIQEDNVDNLEDNMDKEEIQGDSGVENMDKLEIQGDDVEKEVIPEDDEGDNVEIPEVNVEDNLKVQEDNVEEEVTGEGRTGEKTGKPAGSKHVFLVQIKV